MKLLKIGLAAFGVQMAITVLLVASGYKLPWQGLPPAAPLSASTQSVEYQLASIQAGRRVNPDDPLVGNFRDALDNLARKTTTTDRRQIGNLLVRVQRSMAQQGTRADLLDIAQHLGGRVGSGQENLQSLEQIANGYTMLGTRRLTHNTPD